MTGPVLRAAALADVEMMLDWAAAEGWNPGLDDAAAFLAADPEGFFIAELAGRAAASISVVNHGRDFAFLGFYICRPENRGQGIGLRLWEHALAHAGARTVGLDGVAAQEANYARSGFVRAGATLRMEGMLAPRADPRIAVAAPQDMATLVRLDAAANGFARPRFLEAWLAPTPNRRSVVLRRGGEIAGFATLRCCRAGIKAGPVIAPGEADVLALVRAGLDGLAVGAPGASGAPGPVILDVPSENRGLLDALGQRGFAESFATARMYRGKAPRPTGDLGAIATMELG